MERRNSFTPQSSAEMKSGSKGSKRVIIPLLKGLISAGPLLSLFRRFGWGEIATEFREVSWGLGFLAVALLYVAQILAVLRWDLLLKAIEHSVPFSFVFRVSSIGMFFNPCLPTLVGGDAVRWFDLCRKVGRPEASFSSILIDRFAGFFVLLLFFLGGALCFGGSKIPNLDLKLGALAMVSLIIPIVLLVVRPEIFSIFSRRFQMWGWRRASESIAKFEGSLKLYREKRSARARSLVYATAIQLIGMVEVIVIARAVGIDLPMVYYFLYLPLILTVSMLPVTFSGLGVREGVAVYLFALHGVEPAKGIALSLLGYLSAVWVSSIGLVFYWFEKVPARVRPLPISVDKNGTG